jgi:hypothetical protein
MRAGEGNRVGARAWEIKIGRDAIPTYVVCLYCVPLLGRVSHDLLGRDGDQRPQGQVHALRVWKAKLGSELPVSKLKSDFIDPKVY